MLRRNTQTPVQTNSKVRRDRDEEHKPKTRRLMNAKPEGNRIKEHSPQERNQRNYKHGMSKTREDKDEVRVVRMTDGREDRVTNAGNEKTMSTDARRKQNMMQERS